MVRFMNIDRILETMNRFGAAYILIGGVNYLLRHDPVSTFDIDLWVRDMPENLARCEAALADIEAQWGPSEDDWQPVAQLGPGWLARQTVYCLTSPHGPVDIFRHVKGLADWDQSRARAEERKTVAGVAYVGLCDEDMLQCQMALPEHQRRADRVRALQDSIRRASP
jgi:hypothetical protein